MKLYACDRNGDAQHFLEDVEGKDPISVIASFYDEHVVYQFSGSQTSVIKVYCRDDNIDYYIVKEGEMSDQRIKHPFQIAELERRLQEVKTLIFCCGADEDVFWKKALQEIKESIKSAEATLKSYCDGKGQMMKNKRDIIKRAKEFAYQFEPYPLCDGYCESHSIGGFYAVDDYEALTTIKRVVMGKAATIFGPQATINNEWVELFDIHQKAVGRAKVRWMTYAVVE